MPARQILGILRFAPLRMTSEGLGMTRSDSILPGKISVTRRKDFSRLWAAQREFCSRFLRGRFPFRLIVHSDRPLDRSLAGTGNQLTLGWRIHRALGDVCDPTLARRHQNPTSAPPYGTETVPWLPGRRWSRKRPLADIKKRRLRPRTQENHDPHPNASGDYACLPRWIMI